MNIVHRSDQIDTILGIMLNIQIYFLFAGFKVNKR